MAFSRSSSSPTAAAAARQQPANDPLMGRYGSQLFGSDAALPTLTEKPEEAATGGNSTRHTAATSANDAESHPSRSSIGNSNSNNDSSSVQTQSRKSSVGSEGAAPAAVERKPPPFVLTLSSQVSRTDQRVRQQAQM